MPGAGRPHSLVRPRLCWQRWPGHATSTFDEGVDHAHPNVVIQNCCGAFAYAGVTDIAFIVGVAQHAVAPAAVAWRGGALPAADIGLAPPLGGGFVLGLGESCVICC
jgi:hypothetical protein